MDPARHSSETGPGPNDPTVGHKDLTSQNSTLGTVSYKSPEQIVDKPLDERTDLFSFGVTLYEMATGSPPFDRQTTGATFGAILHESAELPSHWNRNAPQQLDGIIGKALEKNRELRYQHASEMRADLQRLKRDSASGQISAAIAGPMTVAGVSAAGRQTRWKIALPVLLATFLVVCLIGGGLYYRSHQPRKVLTEKDTIVLTDFANRTGDPIFDDTLKTALNVSLRQSPFLNVLPESKVAKTLKLMTSSRARSSRPNWPANCVSGRAAQPTLPARLAVWAANMCWN